nr:immunoglobulin light chain junction region [Macaca mulatta]
CQQYNSLPPYMYSF